MLLRKLDPHLALRQALRLGEDLAEDLVPRLLSPGENTLPSYLVTSEKEALPSLRKSVRIF
jgi:hypothetical protein